MKVIKSYESFNQRRYGNPWVAIVDPKTAKPDFSRKVGGYTGGYNRGEAGELYVNEPQDGEFLPIKSENLIEALSSASSEEEQQ